MFQEILSLIGPAAGGAARAGHDRAMGAGMRQPTTAEVRPDEGQSHEFRGGGGRASRLFWPANGVGCGPNFVAVAASMRTENRTKQLRVFGGMSVKGKYGAA